MSKSAAPPGTDFGQKLRALMSAAGYHSDADFSRATGLNSSLLSKWMSGASQPNVESLRKIAPHLRGVRLGDLIVMAGIATPAELGMIGEPPPLPADPIPDPLLQTVNQHLTDPRLPEHLRDNLRRGVQTALDLWLSWLKTIAQETPTGKARAARR